MSKEWTAATMGRKGGLQRKKNLTPDERQAIGVKGSNALWEKIWGQVDKNECCG